MDDTARADLESFIRWISPAKPVQPARQDRGSKPSRHDYLSEQAGVKGRRLLFENPLHDVQWPKEKNARRPVAPHQRYMATLEHVDEVDPEGRLRAIVSLPRWTGAIRWDASTDKMGLLHISPIFSSARDELDLYVQRNPRVGDVPLFPAPADQSSPMRRDTAATWLRRLWASERKSLPDVDVAAAGGWKDTRALKLSYQHADPETVLRVVENR